MPILRFIGQKVTFSLYQKLSDTKIAKNAFADGVLPWAPLGKLKTLL